MIKSFIDGEPESMKDVRLLYLACHNIIKKRGHFLFLDKSDFSVGGALDESISEFLEYLNEDLEIDLGINADTILKEVLQNTEMTASRKERLLKEKLEIKNTEKQKCEIIKMLVGNKYKLHILYDDKKLEEINPNETAFSKVDFDAFAVENADKLGERFELILKANAIYKCLILFSIIGTNKYLSEAKVKAYKKHKKDLCKLKKLIRKEYTREDYNLLFRKPQEPATSKEKPPKNTEYNYCDYVASGKTSGKKVLLNKDTKGDKEKLYKLIKKVLEKKENPINDKTYNYIMSEIEKDTFLPLQVNKRNSEIPYQLRKAELKKILDNAENYFPFLKERDEKNLTVKEKIIKLLTFKTPYYIGVVNETHKEKFPERCWVVRKPNTENKKLTPWNFFDIVDEDKTAEAFIQSRTNKCTYLPSEKVLPKNSLLYSEYTVLNEINNIKVSVNGIEIFANNVQLKKDLFNKVFKNKKKVTQKAIQKFLINEGKCKKDDDILITGVDTECTSSLTSYIEFKKIFDKTDIDIETDSVKEKLENIIFWISVYDEGEGKKMLKEKITKTYPGFLSEQQLEKVLHLKFTGWGRFSKKFLTEITSPFKGETDKINIITALRKYNLNLMELLSNNYDFSKSIEEFNKANTKPDKNKTTLSYKNLVEPLFVSPAVKRMIWRTLCVAKEIKSITKQDPKKIFIEMARGSNEKKGRTKSRYAKLKDLYKNCKDDVLKLKKENSKEYSFTKYNNLDFRSDKLYLYYLQAGKCMYCGESLELGEGDVDHIYPQSKIKDDSFNNIVLVHTKCNQNKGDRYPLDKEIQNKQIGFWNRLYKSSFITTEKFNRLTRTNALSAEEVGKFIARQLVQTRHATKVAAKLIKNIFPSSEIVYVKAQNVSAFRQKFDIYKCRELNDAHHAHDAYLNIVVGNVYNTKFTKDPFNFIKDNYAKEEIKTYNYFKLFNNDVERNGVFAWDKDKSIITVKKMLNRRTPLYTRYASCKSGELFKQTIHKKGSGQMPLKSKGALSKIEKYGGYDSIGIAYYILVKYQNKKKIIRSLENVPLYLLNNDKKSINKNTLEKYLTKILGTSDFKIVIPKIKVNSLLKIDGFFYHITGKDGDDFSIRPAVQFYCDKDMTLFFKRIIQFNSLQDKLKQDKLKNETLKAFDDFTMVNYVYKNLLNQNDKGNIEEKEFETTLRKKSKEVYDFLLDKYNNTIYKNRRNPSTMGKLSELKIEGNKLYIEKFNALNTEEQLEALQKMLRFFATARSFDLKIIGGKATEGRPKFMKNFANIKECILISQSVTGLFERRKNIISSDEENC